MPLLLNIDTATEQASVCLSNNNEVLAMEISTEQKNHASFLQPAIQKVLSCVGKNLSSVDAVAVTNGPGSYTGLRVGLASAKGLCFALNKPLILINTLEVMAMAAIKETAETQAHSLFCPLIDARRMEVFTALYNQALTPIIEPSAVIVDEFFMSQYLNKQPVIFSGSGAFKLKNITNHPHALFSETVHTAIDMIEIALEKFSKQTFANLAYSEPFYLKAFYTPIKK